MKGLIVLLAIKIALVTSKCPEASSIAPCVCFHDTSDVQCTGNMTELPIYNLDPTVQWSVLYIHHTNLTKIGSISLGNTTWDKIYIHNNPVLRNLELNSYNDPRITLWIANNTIISNANVYAVVKQLKNTEVIFLESNDLASPSSFMFNAESRVKYFRINNNKIVRIHSNTFTGAKFLKVVQLDRNKIYAIDPNGLDFTHESEDRRTIAVILDNNHLNETSFNKSTFKATNSSIKIMLSLENNEFTRLNKEVFEPFLSNSRNELYFDNNDFKCDCSFKWLLDESIAPRVFSVDCVEKHRSLFQLNISDLCGAETTTTTTTTTNETQSTIISTSLPTTTTTTTPEPTTQTTTTTTSVATTSQKITQELMTNSSAELETTTPKDSF